MSTPPSATRRLRGALLPLAAIACAGDAPRDPGGVVEPGPPAVVLRDVAYAVTELPTLGGASASANAINGEGLVVGAAADAQGVSQPVAWRGGAVTRLASGAAGGAALAVNARGDVGGYVGAGQAVAGRLWLADGRVRAPAFGVPVTLGTGAAILTCCTAVARLNHRLQAVGRTGPARAVGDTAHVIGADAAVLADFAVDTAAFVTPVYGSSATSGPNALSGLNNAGHAVGWKFELESVTPLLRGVAFPAAFDTLPAGAPRRRPDTGHGFTYTYFVDDADRVYGASEGATFAAASGGAATWLYPYTGNAPLRAVSPGGLLAAGPTAEACTAVGARGCLPAGTLFLWRAADRAVMRVVLPVPWAVELVTGVNDAGQLVGQATDGARHIAVLLTPAAPLPAPGG